MTWIRTAGEEVTLTGPEQIRPYDMVRYGPDELYVHEVVMTSHGTLDVNVGTLVLRTQAISPDGLAAPAGGVHTVEFIGNTTIIPKFPFTVTRGIWKTLSEEEAKKMMSEARDELVETLTDL